MTPNVEDVAPDGQPSRNDRLTARFQTRRFIVVPAAVVCKPLFGGGQTASLARRTSTVISNRGFWPVWGIEITARRAAAAVN